MSPFIQNFIAVLHFLFTCYTDFDIDTDVSFLMETAIFKLNMDYVMACLKMSVARQQHICMHLENK